MCRLAIVTGVEAAAAGRVYLALSAPRRTSEKSHGAWRATPITRPLIAPSPPPSFLLERMRRPAVSTARRDEGNSTVTTPSAGGSSAQVSSPSSSEGCGASRSRSGPALTMRCPSAARRTAIVSTSLAKHSTAPNGLVTAVAAVPSIAVLPLPFAGPTPPVTPRDRSPALMKDPSPPSHSDSEAESAEEPSSGSLSDAPNAMANGISALAVSTASFPSASPRTVASMPLRVGARVAGPTVALPGRTPLRDAPPRGVPKACGKGDERLGVEGIGRDMSSPIRGIALPMLSPPSVCVVRETTASAPTTPVRRRLVACEGATVPRRPDAPKLPRCVLLTSLASAVPSARVDTLRLALPPPVVVGDAARREVPIFPPRLPVRSPGNDGSPSPSASLTAAEALGDRKADARRMLARRLPVGDLVVGDAPSLAERGDRGPKPFPPASIIPPAVSFPEALAFSCLTLAFSTSHCAAKASRSARSSAAASAWRPFARSISSACPSSASRCASRSASIASSCSRTSCSRRAWKSPCTASKN